MIQDFYWCPQAVKEDRTGTEFFSCRRMAFENNLRSPRKKSKRPTKHMPQQNREFAERWLPGGLPAVGQ